MNSSRYRIQPSFSTYSIYDSRPIIPQSSEDVSDEILDKLEQAGRVPSKEKFRRMACNVSLTDISIRIFYRPLICNIFRPLSTPVLVHTMIAVRAIFLFKSTIFD
jgi:hypothetical protein